MSCASCSLHGYGANTVSDFVLFPSYKVYDIQVDTIEKHTVLKRWEEVKGVDFWDRAGKRVMIAPMLQDTFERFLTLNGFTFVRSIEDVEA